MFSAKALAEKQEKLIIYNKSIEEKKKAKCRMPFRNFLRSKQQNIGKSSKENRRTIQEKRP